MSRTVAKAEENVSALANPKAGFDPVCYMAIDDETAIIVAHAEKDYGFCSEDCAAKFKANPDSYLAAGTGAGRHNHDHGSDDGHDH
jgi:YHS domain-containing protein